MPKVTQRSHRRISSGSPRTYIKREAADDTLPAATKHQSVTIEGDKYILAFEQHKVDSQINIRVHISERGALGSTSTASGVHRQGEKQAATVVINNDSAGTTIDMSFRVSNKESINIIITNANI